MDIYLNRIYINNTKTQFYKSNIYTKLYQIQYLYLEKFFELIYMFLNNYVNLLSEK